MNRNESQKGSTPSPKHSSPGPTIPSASHADDWSQGDPVWDLLSEASHPEPNPFFARNVVRSVRLQQQESASLGQRIMGLLKARPIVATAAACACILATVHFTNQGPSAIDNPLPAVSQNPAGTNVSPSPETSDSEVSSELSEILIEENLIAAANNPSMFTRDEVVTMLGF